MIFHGTLLREFSRELTFESCWMQWILWKIHAMKLLKVVWFDIWKFIKVILPIFIARVYATSLRDAKKIKNLGRCGLVEFVNPTNSSCIFDIFAYRLMDFGLFSHLKWNRVVYNFPFILKPHRYNFSNCKYRWFR